METNKNIPETSEELCELIFQIAKEASLNPASEIILLEEILRLLRQLCEMQQDMQETLDELAGIQLAKEAVAQENAAWMEEMIRREADKPRCNSWPFTSLPQL